MVSEFNNDTLAGMIKTNPELENIIQTVIASNKNTTSMFVHELRNPLALLKGTVQYIEMKHPEVKEFKYWDQVQDLINDMENIMQDASMLNNSTLLNREATDLIALMSNIISNFMPQALTQQIDLSMNITPGCEKYFSSYSCDGSKLKQVFTNMIKNAFEATKSGDFVHKAPLRCRNL
jgi:signal transduction histidine kinase